MAWQRQRGLPDVAERLNTNLSDGRRRRISRALSFHLRHDEGLRRDESGWAEVSDLAKLVGSGTDPLDLVLVASDFREPRFEVSGTRIRARYGHTRSAAIEHADAEPGIALFHATSLDVAETVLLSGGLKPMGRQYVHLSSDPWMALASGGRHGPGLLLTMESEQLDGLRHAAEWTYVVPKATPRSLRVAPVWYPSQVGSVADGSPAMAIPSTPKRP